MALVNMDYNGKSIPEKIAKGRLYISKLTGNVDFPTPNPPLADLTADTDALEAANNAAQDGGKSSKQTLKNAEDKLDGQVSILGAYIQTTSLGNENKILSTGALVRKDSTPIGELPAPTDVLAKTGDMEGTVDVKWKKVIGAKSYVLQIATDLATANWSYLGASTSAKFTAPGLTSGKKYMFRVAALGAAGLSPWSDPAIGMAA
jgi:hypothetical protein